MSVPSMYGHAHVHSQFSALDGLSMVPKLVEAAAKEKQPFIGLTDHGNMSGVVQLYKACQKHGVLPYPGLEGYLIDPEFDGDWRDPPKGSKVGRYHFGVLARTEEGYKALVKFTSMTHTRPRFNRFPRADLSDLAELGQAHGEDLILTTGCFFGWLQQTLVNKGPGEALKVASMYAEWFPHTFVELQNHNILHPSGITDDDIVDQLVDIANQVGLPIIATQDNHYLSQQEKPAHALMKRMVYGGADDEFPGDSFHFASTDWVREHYTEKQWARVEEGCARLVDINEVKITPLDKFVVDVPSMPGVKAPKRLLRTTLWDNLDEYLDELEASKAKREKYTERLKYEHNVIRHLKMDSYFVIWQKFAEWCREEHIAIEARGSANGSLVCFLLGVTQVDPLIWDVDFERFLTKDRIKPPDIDMDIEDVERPRAVRYLLSLFDACQIGTYGRLGITVDKDTGEERGSVMATWQQHKRRECEEIAMKRYEAGKLKNKGDVVPYGRGIFARKYGDVTSVEDVRDVDYRDYKGLRQLASMTAYKSYGVHAGGVLLSGNNIRIEDYIPTMLVASSDTKVTMFDMDDVEEFGLLKMDVLGQATLRLMKLTQEHIGQPDPTDFAWISNRDKNAFKLLREGRTDTGIFHFEGYTKAKGGKEVGVKSVKDSILVHALYMPGPMDVAPGMEMSAKDHYVTARRNPNFRSQITYDHDVIKKHLEPTLGAFVFQNQVLAILRDLGMDTATVNTFLKIVKDSGSGAIERNQERSDAVYRQYLKLAKEAGVPDAEKLWGNLTTFAKYGFNKAHATGYGIRSYRCAYLKAHYPLEFMTGLLQTWAGREKEKVYLREVRRMGIRLLPPHVNISGVSWTMDTKRGAIRKGLVSIPGIGEPTALPIIENAPYKNVEDMIDRLPGRVITGGKRYLDTGQYSGTLAKLRDVGALDGIDE